MRRKLWKSMDVETVEIHETMEDKIEETNKYEDEACSLSRPEWETSKYVSSSWWTEKY